MIKYHLKSQQQQEQQQFHLNRNLLQITTNSILLITKADILPD